MAAVDEMTRVLRPGGQALIYVWALEQKLDNKKSNYLKDSKTSGGQATDAFIEKQCDDVTTNNDSLKKPAMSSVSDVTITSDGTCLDASSSTSALVSCDQQTPSRRYLDVHVNRTEFQSKDLLVPWHLRSGSAVAGKQTGDAEQPDSVFHRFYHVFEKGELESLCSELNSVRIQSSYYDKGNWCVVLEKLQGPG